MLFRSGQMRSEGEPKAVIQAYLEDLFGSAGVREDPSASDTPSSSGRPASITPRPIEPDDLFSTRPLYNKNEYRWGDRQAVLYDFELTDRHGNERVFLESGDVACLRARIYFAEALEKVIFGFTVKTVDGRVVYGANSRERGIPIPRFSPGDSIEIKFEFSCALIPNEYFISLGIALDDDQQDNVAIDRRYDAICLPITGGSGDFGIADLGLKIELITDA